MKIDHTTEEGVLIELFFETSYPLRYYGGYGKSFPETTECHVCVDGVLIASGKVVKHHSDPRNPNLAARLAAKEPVAFINSIETRKDLWKLILSKFPVNN